MFRFSLQTTCDLTKILLKSIEFDKSTKYIPSTHNHITEQIQETNFKLYEQKKIKNNCLHKEKVQFLY